MKTKTLTVEARIQQLVEKHGGQNAAAEAIGLSPSYLSRVVNGQRKPSTFFLKKIGLKRNVYYTLL